MAIDPHLSAALDSLDEYREEAVVLEAAIENLSGQREALARILAPLATADRGGVLADVFLALRRHFLETRELLEVAVDFVETAAELLGKPPAEVEARPPHLGAEQEP